MTHHATPRFWELLESLPDHIQTVARRQHQLLLDDPQHPSLRLKPVGRYWSARVTQDYRVLGVRDEETDAMIWFFIGSHADYDKLLNR